MNTKSTLEIVANENDGRSTLFEHDEFRVNLSRAIQSGDLVYAGSHSYTWQGVKYRLGSVCRLWPDAEGEVRWLTPGEAAREELKRYFPELRRIGWPGRAVRLLNFRPPFLYTGVVRGGLWLVDLCSAYWSIYKKLWLNVAFPRGKGTLSLTGIAGRLKDWKPARNAIMGITRSTRMTMYHKGKAKNVAIKNPYLSPALWATVCQVLQDISYLEKPVYVNTDGFVFDREARMRNFCESLDAHGLTYTITAGEGQILGWNCYQIGARRTGFYGKYAWSGGRAFDNRYPKRERSFLQWWSKIS